MRRTGVGGYCEILLYSGAMFVMTFASPQTAWCDPVNPPPATTTSGSDSVPPPVSLDTVGGVSLHDGNFNLSVNDLTIGDLSLVRHTQQASVASLDLTQFGPRFSSNFDIYITFSGQGQVTGGIIPPTPIPTQYNIAPLYDLAGPSTILPARYHYTVHIGNSASGAYTETLPFQAPTIVWPANADALSGTLSDLGGSLSTGANFQYVDKDGDTYNFNSGVSAHASSQTPSGPPLGSLRVSSISYANGRVQSFFYNNVDQLHLVLDSTGYAMLFDYNSAGYASDACAIDLARFYANSGSTCSGQGLIVNYGYTTETATVFGGATATLPLLTSVTDPLNNITKYNYTTTYYANNYVGQYVTCIQPPGYQACKVQINYGNLSNGQIYQRSISLIDGTNWIINPADVNGNSTNVEYGGSCCYTASTIDPFGATSSYNFSWGSVISKTDPLGNVTSYQWGGGWIQETTNPAYTLNGSLLLGVVSPAGDTYQAYYLGPLNSISKQVWTPKPGSNQTPHVVTYTYGASWNGIGLAFGTGATYQNAAKPLSRVDENGNETDWTYASWGGTLSEMGPPPVAGSARPLKLFSYQQSSANVLNASGALVSTSQPVWLPATETECQTLAGSSTLTCDANAPQIVTTYLYAAPTVIDNLLLRGRQVSGGGKTLTTCYTYDQWSHRISETAPNAGLTACP